MIRSISSRTNSTCYIITVLFYKFIGKTLDFLFPVAILSINYIGQFVTILSVNKTRIFKMDALRPFFVVGWVHGFSVRLFFSPLPDGSLCQKETAMNRSRYLTQAAIIAALYAALTHLQNLLLPGTASMAIQFRASEALCVLAFFTPAAIPGLTLGCLLFNLTSGMALPLDFLVGSLASCAAASLMWCTRKLKIGRLPLPGLAMPAVTNALLVGWELTVYIGGGFWLNALYVAIGELAVLYTLGIMLYFALGKPGVSAQIFR